MRSSCGIHPLGVGPQPRDQITKRRPCDEQWQATCVNATFRDATYIAEKTSGLEDFGAIKINKTIVFADMEAFRATGESITGAQHHRVKMGPVPKHILVAQRQLEDGGALSIERSLSGHKRIAKRSPKAGIFTPDELAIVDCQISILQSMTGNAVSLLSHDVRWNVLQDQDLMPYEFAFLDDAITDKDRSDAKVMAEEMGW